MYTQFVVAIETIDLEDTRIQCVILHCATPTNCSEPQSFPLSTDCMANSN